MRKEPWRNAELKFLAGWRRGRHAARLMIFTCQPGFTDLLAGELSARGYVPVEQGAGWVRTEHGGRNTEDRGQGADDGGRTELPDLCFPQMTLLDPVEIAADSVNALGAKITEQFLTTAKTERFEGEWPFLFEEAAEMDGLGRRVKGVEKVVQENLRKRMGRVARLAVADKPRGVARLRGLYVFFVDFKRAYVSREAVFGGQRRMADDEQAPSRSYLKVEEAYIVLGREPAFEETVADLGAAPGGWSYSASKRGAKIVAVDNGPLKGGAYNNYKIEHRMEDAFTFRPAPDQVFDWMFCDLVEEPHHVMENLIQPWLERGWCRRFVVILKFGRVDPLALLRQVRAPESVFSRCATNVRVRHLYHDREEFTIVGELK
jgi:23S rRNA (cytidine2498-2'-O)-methyltransferase